MTMDNGLEGAKEIFPVLGEDDLYGSEETLGMTGCGHDCCCCDSQCKCPPCKE